MQRTDSLETTLMLGKIEAGGEGDNRGWDGWMASPTRWIWIWVSSGSWWWTGKPGMLQSMGSQKVRHDWVTKLIDWTDPKIIVSLMETLWLLDHIFISQWVVSEPKSINWKSSLKTPYESECLFKAKPSWDRTCPFMYSGYYWSVTYSLYRMVWSFWASLCSAFSLSESIHLQGYQLGLRVT